MLNSPTVIDIIINERLDDGAAKAFTTEAAQAATKRLRRKTSYTPHKIIRDYIFSHEPFQLN